MKEGLHIPPARCVNRGIQVDETDIMQQSVIRSSPITKNKITEEFKMKLFNEIWLNFPPRQASPPVVVFNRRASSIIDNDCLHSFGLHDSPALKPRVESHVITPPGEVEQISPSFARNLTSLSSPSTTNLDYLIMNIRTPPTLQETLKDNEVYLKMDTSLSIITVLSYYFYLEN